MCAGGFYLIWVSFPVFKCLSKRQHVEGFVRSQVGLYCDFYFSNVCSF